MIDLFPLRSRSVDELIGEVDKPLELVPERRDGVGPGGVVGPAPSGLAPTQASIDENLEMVTHRRLGQIKVILQVEDTDRALGHRQQVKDLDALRVGKRAGHIRDLLLDWVGKRCGLDLDEVRVLGESRRGHVPMLAPD